MDRMIASRLVTFNIAKPARKLKEDAEARRSSRFLGHSRRRIKWEQKQRSENIAGEGKHISAPWREARATQTVGRAG